MKDMGEIVTHDVHAVFSVEDLTDLAGLLWWLKWCGARIVKLERINRPFDKQATQPEEVRS